MPEGVVHGHSALLLETRAPPAYFSFSTNNPSYIHTPVHSISQLFIDILMGFMKVHIYYLRRTLVL
ncbi:hypothetical protein L208DRAFT_504274 [Tricholoma matsutake]|nr:hypothetical protein L208DRAFT_504274 [Tricholoma matsutake 945]